jgi:propanol-preferring alcohol dehydrogenase
MHDFEPGMMPWKMPFTLGHENAGWVDSVGDGVTTVAEGDAVAVYGAWGCRKCSRCQQGFENFCENPAEAPVVRSRSGHRCLVYGERHSLICLQRAVKASAGNLLTSTIS